MNIDLTDVSASDISAALVHARRSAGSPAMGMVMTLVLVADEDCQADAVAAASESAKEHPSRIIAVIQHRERAETQLDAQVQVGLDAGPGENLLLRTYGQLNRHADSVVTPLLLSDSPVVAWWPGRAPKSPAQDPIGQLAQRRVTDASAASRPLQALVSQAENYERGDTDLAWTRTTPWRALLASALDQSVGKVTGATVEAERSNASAELLATWLGRQLRVEVTRKSSKGPGITAVRLHTRSGDVAITRPDGRRAQYTLPNQPDQHVALNRRDTSQLIAEELRWLDPDEVYEETIRELLRLRQQRRSQRATTQRGSSQRGTTQRSSTSRAGRT